MKVALKKTIRKIKYIVLNIKKPDFYAERGRQLIESDKNDKAISVLEKGLHHYPNSLLINREYAILKMNTGFKEDSAIYWNKVFKSGNKKLLMKNDFILASEVYKTKNQRQQFIKTINESPKKIQEDIDLKEIKILHLYKLARWKDIVTIVEETYREIKGIPSHIRIKLAKAYRMLRIYEKADYLLRESLIEAKNDIDVALQYAEVAIERKNWIQAIERYEYVKRLLGDTADLEIIVRLAMLYKVIGDHGKSKIILKNAPTPKETENVFEYELITLFDNGESRIEYYKQKQDTDKVVIVFDSLDMNWKEDPFGFRLLSRQDIDIIAVRKKDKGTYQQDLSQEDFNHTLEKLVAGYEDKIAYGHSLGAYLSLYYASNLNCRILSLAPRLSIHPIFGRKNFIDQYSFHHNQSNNYNENIQPIVVYDPKSMVDNKYVNSEVLVKFPNAKLIKMPYGGHGIARHLLRMGVLKEFILKVIDEECPSYDRRLKGKSANYLRLLGGECLKRNKLNWAADLAERAVELLPRDRYVIKFQVDVYRKKERFEKAIAFMQESIKLVPKNLYVRLILIDLYIETKDYFQAEYELKESEQLLGTKNELIEKYRTISESIMLEINKPIQFIE